MKRPLIRLCVLWRAAVAGLCLVAAGRAAAAPPHSAADAHLCAPAIGYVEDSWELPSELLHAIAIAESGRWDAGRQARFAWPWTVTAGGSGLFFATKRAAIAHVRRLQAEGVRNIDVGCMQVNLRYHPHAFRTLEDAFDPATNASYAASLLHALRLSTRSWSRAVAHYHSATRHLGRPYWKKVLAIWNAARARAFEQARRRTMETSRQRRAARRLAWRKAAR